MIRITNCVLVVLVCAGISGCSTAQHSELYQSWQHQAYSVYKMPTPQGTTPKAAALPARFDPSKPQQSRTAAPVNKQPWQPLSTTEQNYIASHYGL